MRQTKANFIFNIAGMAAPILVSLATVPLYVSHIGTARYGVLSIVWLLLGYFGFLDLGLSRASVNALSKLKHAPPAERSKVFMTAVILNLGLGIFGGVLLYFIGGFLLERLLDAPAALKPEISAALPWVAALLPLALISGVAVGALEAQDRFLVVNVLQVGCTTLGQVAPVVCAALISPSLAIVVPAAVLSRAASVLLTLGFVLYEETPSGLRSFDKGRARELLGYGGWVSVSAIINPLLMSLDQLVVGSVLGVAAVANYAVPMNLVMRSQIIATALSRTLFPQWSRAAPDDARLLAGRALTALACGYGALCAGAIVVVDRFMIAWMGADFAAVAGPVAELLLIGAWINGLAYIPALLLQGQNRPDIVAKFHVLEVVPFVAALWFLTRQFGLIGAAAAWALRVAIDAGLLCWAAGFPRARVLTLLPPLGFIVAGYAFSRSWDATLFEALSTAALLAAAATITGMIYDIELRISVNYLFDMSRR